MERVLNEHQLVYVYVVYRTRRFRPQTDTRESMKVRMEDCYRSGLACSRAHALLNRPCKGVVHRELSLREGLFEGKVTFDAGDEQHIWVQREMMAAKELQETFAKTGNNTKLNIDPDALKVYLKRYDVMTFKAKLNLKMVDDAHRRIIFDSSQFDDIYKDEESKRRALSRLLQLHYPTVENPMNIIEWEIDNHGSFTDLGMANESAAGVFIDMMQPLNRRISDNCYYRDTVIPRIEETWEDWDKSTPFMMEFTPSIVDYRYEFAQVRIRVIATKLSGPMDLGEMVVETPVANGAAPPRDVDEQAGLTQDQQMEDQCELIVTPASEMDVDDDDGAAAAEDPGDEDSSDVSEEL